MIQIIKRTEGERHIKETVLGEKIQVSFNSWGHLSVRVIQQEDNGATGIAALRPADTLVVFDKATSAQIIQFCDRIRAGGIPF